MSNWFDKEMKKLMKKLDEMFKKTIFSSPGMQDLKSGKNSKTFEKKAPGFHMKVEMFNLTRGSGDFARDTISELGENKKAEVTEEEKEEDKPGKLALRRFKEKNKEDEE